MKAAMSLHPVTIVPQEESTVWNLVCGSHSHARFGANMRHTCMWNQRELVM